MKINPIQELKELSVFIEGMLEVKESERLKRVAYWLEKISHHVCGQGYIGCFGGEKCTSDHK